jgi:hypothetical protein
MLICCVFCAILRPTVSEMCLFVLLSYLIHVSTMLVVVFPDWEGCAFVVIALGLVTADPEIAETMFGIMQNFSHDQQQMVEDDRRSRYLGYGRLFNIR